MSMIDRQRIAAVKAMEAMGYTFDGNGWNVPTASADCQALAAEADALHSLLVVRAGRVTDAVRELVEDAH